MDDDHVLFDEEPSFSHFMTSTPHKGSSSRFLHDSDTEDFDLASSRRSVQAVQASGAAATSQALGRATSSGTSSHTLVDSSPELPLKLSKSPRKQRVSLGQQQQTTTTARERPRSSGSSSSSSGIAAAAVKRPSPSRDLNEYIHQTLKSTSPPALTGTPNAPGAFPLRPNRSAATTRVATEQQQRTLPSASQRIHDAFERHITGPDGALARSAERRAKAATLATPSPPPPRRHHHRSAAEVQSNERDNTTPHPVGWYSPTPLPNKQRASRHGFAEEEYQDDDDEAEEKAALAKKLREMSARQRATESRPSAYFTSATRTGQELPYDGDADSSSVEEEEADVGEGVGEQPPLDERSRINFAMTDTPPPPARRISTAKRRSRPSSPPTRSPSPPLPPPPPVAAIQDSPPRARRTPSQGRHVLVKEEEQGKQGDAASRSLEHDEVTFLKNVLPELRTIVARIKSGSPPEREERLDERGLPLPDRQQVPSHAGMVEMFRRRKKESDHRAKVLEDEQRQFEAQARARQERERHALADNLKTKQDEEAALLRKLEDLSTSIADLAPVLANSVEQRLAPKLKQRTIAWWFVLVHVVLVGLMVRWSNVRAERLYMTMTVDPFYAAFDGWTLTNALVLDSGRTAVVGEETLRLFGTVS